MLGAGPGPAGLPPARPALPAAAPLGPASRPRPGSSTRRRGPEKEPDGGQGRWRGRGSCKRWLWGIKSESYVLAERGVGRQRHPNVGTARRGRRAPRAAVGRSRTAHAQVVVGEGGALTAGTCVQRAALPTGGVANGRRATAWGDAAARRGSVPRPPGPPARRPPRYGPTWGAGGAAAAGPHLCPRRGLGIPGEPESCAEPTTNSPFHTP